MGLDMYLTKRTFIGGHYDHRGVRGTIQLSIDSGKERREIVFNPKKVHSIIEDAGYWRKANAIHAWIVKNCQDGTDDCREAYVDRKKLQELLRICKEVKETKNPAKLPPQSGFFFGSTEIDDGYWQDIDDTIKILTEALLDGSGEFYYHSSW